MHLQDVPQAVRHAWYATGGPHKRKQAKHNKQRKPASNRGTHHPLPRSARPRNLTAPPKRSVVCDLKIVKLREGKAKALRCSRASASRRSRADAASRAINRLGFRRRQRYLGRMSSRPRSRPLAAFIEPCLPRHADKPPAGPDWIHEIKHDGFRIMARLDARGVRLLTRKGHDFADRFPLAAGAVAALLARSCLIDGE